LADVGNEVGFRNTSTSVLENPNYANDLLWVEEGIVSTDFAISDVLDWPDYVFNADYKLPSLLEVEQTIKEKGHLPTMLPGATIEKNGFTVTDMTKRVVTTIEELTLHAIAQKKIIDALIERLDKLEQSGLNK